MWNQAGVIMVSLIWPQSFWGTNFCTRRSSWRFDTDFAGLCRSLAPAMTESPGMTLRSFSIRLTTSGWYSRNMAASASWRRTVPSNSSHMRPQKRVRLYSPLVTAFKPRSCCSLTTCPTASSSTAGSPASSAVRPFSRMASRTSSSRCGRSREPMCSARNGGAIVPVCGSE